MKADVHEVRRDVLEARKLPGRVGHAQPDVVFTKQLHEARIAVALVPDLERVAERSLRFDREVSAVLHPAVMFAGQLTRGRGRARKNGEERFEAFGVEGQLRRQLPKHGPELRLEREHTRREEVRERRSTLAELLVVREKASALHGEDEVWWRLLVPARVARRSLQRIEGAVDLDRTHPAARVPELALLREP